MRQWLAFLCIIACSMAVSGCRDCQGPLVTDLVTITYRQIFNFNEWEVTASDGSIFSRGKIDDGVFMRYRIVSIANKDSQAKLFHFDPNKIHTSDASERPSQPVIGLSGSLPFDVLPGSVSNKGNVTIKVKGDVGAIKQEIRLLLYDSGPNEHVMMVNEAPTQTTVAYRNPLRIPGPDPN